MNRATHQRQRFLHIEGIRLSSIRGDMARFVTFRTRTPLMLIYFLLGGATPFWHTAVLYWLGVGCLHRGSEVNLTAGFGNLEECYARTAKRRCRMRVFIYSACSLTLLWGMKTRYVTLRRQARAFLICTEMMADCEFTRLYMSFTGLGFKSREWIPEGEPDGGTEGFNFAAEAETRCRADRTFNSKRHSSSVCVERF